MCKYRLKYPIFISTVALISGCTTVDKFVIENNTDNPLMVSYVVPTAFYSLGKLLNECFEDDLNTAYLPSISEISDASAIDSDWVDLAPDKYVCNFEDFSISFQLQPNSAARVAYIAGYSGNSEYLEGNDLLITDLTLEGNRGTVSYEGNQVSEAFYKKRIGFQTYVIRYE